VSAALLGIPSGTDPGMYTLVLIADQGRAEWRQEKRIRLTEVDFPEMVIRMNGEMAGLYSDESERKKNESRILWSILTTTDTAALYHFEHFTPPLETGESTAGFGDRRRYRLPDGSESASIHLGHDWWAETGTPVSAAGRGRVVLAAERLLTGNTVIIEHLPGVYTLYYHLDSIDVFEGEMINQGRPIGTVGETGFATGEHLHWEMRVGATPVNALEFLERPLLDTNELISKM
jgi:murein DD-endopeptidase MepM/ murein hydrolase activator NlpD